MRRTKRKDVNIYLTNQDKRKLNEIKYKYHLSYSTIANILVNNLCMELKLDLIEKYIHEDKEQYKTHIRPRDSKYHDKTRYVYTNAIKIYCRNELEKYIKDQRKEQSIKAKIQHELEITVEDNWDGNQFNKKIVRWLKQNREYATKVLESEK